MSLPYLSITLNTHIIYLVLTVLLQRDISIHILQGEEPGIQRSWDNKYLLRSTFFRTERHMK